MSGLVHGFGHLWQKNYRLQPGQVMSPSRI